VLRDTGKPPRVPTIRRRWRCWGGGSVVAIAVCVAGCGADEGSSGPRADRTDPPSTGKAPTAIAPDSRGPSKGRDLDARSADLSTTSTDVVPQPGIHVKVSGDELLTSYAFRSLPEDLNFRPWLVLISADPKGPYIPVASRTSVDGATGEVRQPLPPGPTPIVVRVEAISRTGARSAPVTEVVR
jgi:hypothetical protein